MMNTYTYHEITIGQTESFQKKITLEMEDDFRRITNDRNPLHLDDQFACEISGGRFKGHVVFGMLTVSMLSTIAGVYLPGKYSLIHSIDHISFQKPVYAGDVLTVLGTVKGKQDDLKLLQLEVRITNDKNEVVCKAGMKVLVQK